MLTGLSPIQYPVTGRYINLVGKVQYLQAPGHSGARAPLLVCSHVWICNWNSFNGYAETTNKNMQFDSVLLWILIVMKHSNHCLSIP